MAPVRDNTACRPTTSTSHSQLTEIENSLGGSQRVPRQLVVSGRRSEDMLALLEQRREALERGRELHVRYGGADRVGVRVVGLGPGWGFGAHCFVVVWDEV